LVTDRASVGCELLPERGIDGGFHCVLIQARTVVIWQDRHIPKAEGAIKSGGLAGSIEDNPDDFCGCADLAQTFQRQGATESATMQRRPNHPPS